MPVLCQTFGYTANTRDDGEKMLHNLYYNTAVLTSLRRASLVVFFIFARVTTDVRGCTVFNVSWNCHTMHLICIPAFAN